MFLNPKKFPLFKWQYMAVAGAGAEIMDKGGSGSRVKFYTDPDPAIFLYGSGSREMIRIPRIRIRHTGNLTP